MAFSRSPDGILEAGQSGEGREARIEDVMWQRRPQGLSLQFPYIQHSIWFSEQHKGDSGLIAALRSPQFRWGGGKTGGRDNVRECREGFWSSGQLGKVQVR